MTKAVNDKINKALSDLRFYIRSLSECITIERLNTTYNYVWRSEGILKGIEQMLVTDDVNTIDEAFELSHERSQLMFDAMKIYTDKLYKLMKEGMNERS